MNLNPLFLVEKLRNSRKMRAFGLMTAMNLILLTALLFSRGMAGYSQKKIALNGFALVSCLLFLMVWLIVPIISGMSISHDLSTRRLEILMASGLTKAEVISGKMMSCVVEVALLILAAFPVPAGLLVFGGLHSYYLLELYFFLVSFAVFLTGIGVYCSCLFRRSARAIFMSLLFSFLIVGFSILICYALRESSLLNEGQNLVITMVLMVFNPVAGLLSLMAECIGNQLRILTLFQQFSVIRSGLFFHSIWFLVCVAEWGMSAVFYQRSVLYLEEYLKY